MEEEAGGNPYRNKKRGILKKWIRKPKYVAKAEVPR